MGSTWACNTPLQVLNESIASAEPMREPANQPSWTMHWYRLCGSTICARKDVQSPVTKRVQWLWKNGHIS
ncbi:hypothetical protein K503DRAFT_482235 [Rhizopogon vinicolor AM-OR11-026]|uniref:Uncharacterized protein n=1 Tax=Rhizopogon vinicolor AM-OR11-026 TaxID=1314800 RepID=A0A1B7N9M8_9AGAM|nr:hypothetical protein K503DRAFT_482235 [Rhizopogon vinicolor AM-OR11-026]